MGLTMFHIVGSNDVALVQETFEVFCQPFEEWQLSAARHYADGQFGLANHVHANTVSRFNPGIMSRLTRSMTDMGYTYFDWNVSSGDAGETTSTDQVYLNVVNGCRFDYNVVLQHDIKGFSVDAVERIIIWGLNNGFQFLPLEPGSYNAHHGVNN